MTLDSRQYDYDTISMALDAAQTDVAQGLTKKVNSFTVLTLDGGAVSVRLNSATGDLIALSDGIKIEGIPITELYWTNTAQAGLTAKFFIIWID